MSAAADSAMIVNLINSSMEGPDIERGSAMLFRGVVGTMHIAVRWRSATVDRMPGRRRTDPSFCRGMRQRSHLSIGNDNLDRIVDPMTRIPQCGRQISEWERVSVNPGRVKALLGHQRHRAAGGAAAFAADAIGIDVVLDEMREVHL